MSSVMVSETAPQTIVQSLSRRVRGRTVDAQVRRIHAASIADRQTRQALIALQRDGLAAEREAAKALRRVSRERTTDFRRQARAAWMSRVGRKIDLMAMLSLSRPDGTPLWSVLDPAAGGDRTQLCAAVDAAGAKVGIRLAAGEVTSRWLCVDGQTILTTTRPLPKSYQNVARLLPTGFPPLPARVRELATDPKIRRRAKWVGVLYQPTAWEEVTVDPDPALIVEWRDRPGEYYALAVWGHDGPAIMEFVD